MPRFVILEHDHPFLHWDLMLERDGVLKTWRLAAAPTEPGVIAAEYLADHRLAYLDYEGPLSGNRGAVCRWDQGTYEVSHEDSLQWDICLHGVRVQGIAVLTKDAAGMWTFSLSK